MFVIYYVNKKKIFILNMCKICVEIINILWGFFFIVERVRIIFKYKFICSINNYKILIYKKKLYFEKR